MKVLIGAALLWILARREWQTYLAFATTPAKPSDVTK